MTTVDDQIGRQRRRNQMIEPFHDLRAGDGLREEGGGRETIQVFRRNSSIPTKTLDSKIKRLGINKYQFKASDTEPVA